jgi:hypothetical protein
MEYLTDELGERFSEEIALGDPQQLRQVALAQAQARDYVRQTQVRLLVHPLLERLRAELGANAQVEAHLLGLLSLFRAEDAATRAMVRQRDHPAQTLRGTCAAWTSPGSPFAEPICSVELQMPNLWGRPREV